MRVRWSVLKLIFNSFVPSVIHILKTFSVPFVYLPFSLYWYARPTYLNVVQNLKQQSDIIHIHCSSFFYNSTKLFKNYVSRHVTYTRIKTYKWTQQNCCSGNLVSNINMTLLFICLNLVWKLSQIELTMCSVYE